MLISRIAVTAAAVIGLALASAPDAHAGKDKAKERAEKRKENAEEKRKAAKEKQQEAKEKAAEKRQQDKDDAKAKREEAKAKADEKREEKSEKAQDRVDDRQDKQAERIEHGIKKGHLTEAEASALATQQQKIADLEANLNEDGKLSRADAQALRKELNAASRMIWGEKHDTEGEQMAVRRLGKDIVVKKEVSDKFNSGEMTGAEGKAMAHDFRRMMAIKRALNGDGLSDTKRQGLETEYTNLLNRYYDQI